MRHLWSAVHRKSGFCKRERKKTILVLQNEDVEAASPKKKLTRLLMFFKQCTALGIWELEEDWNDVIKSAEVGLKFRK